MKRTLSIALSLSLLMTPLGVSAAEVPEQEIETEYTEETNEETDEEIKTEDEEEEPAEESREEESEIEAEKQEQEESQKETERPAETRDELETDFSAAGIMASSAGKYVVVGDTLISYTGKTDTEISIPESLGIRVIATDAFSHLENATKVVIPEGVTVIQPYAFACSYKLSSVQLPGTLTTIGTGAFYRCALSSISIPDSVTSIEGNAFSLNKLSNVKLPAKLQSLGSYAFSSNSLTSIDIPATLAVMNTNAFSNNRISAYNVEADNPSYSSDGGVLYNKEQSELLIYPYYKTAETYTIPSTVTTIVQDAFYEVDTIKKVIITGDLVTIGKNAFRGCSSLKEINLPDTVAYIGDYAFYQTKLEEINLGPALKGLGIYAFRGCDIESVEIPASLSVIPEGAFDNCRVRELVLQHGVAVIESSAFKGLYNLESVKLPSSIRSIASDAFLNVPIDVQWYVYEGSCAAEYVTGQAYPYVSMLGKVIEEGSVIVEVPDEIDISEMEVVEISEGDENYQLAQQILEETFSLYDIEVKDSNGNKVSQLEEKVTVSIRIPEEFAENKCEVYYIDPMGSAVPMGAVNRDGYAVFKTDHFSLYALVPLEEPAGSTVSGIEITSLDGPLMVQLGSSENSIKNSLYWEYVRITYFNGVIEQVVFWDISDEIEISGFDNSKLGSQEIVLTYKGGTTTIPVTVWSTDAAEELKKQLENLDVDSLTLADKDRILEMWETYQSLSYSEKNEVSNIPIAILYQALERISDLEEEVKGGDAGTDETKTGEETDGETGDETKEETEETEETNPSDKNKDSAKDKSGKNSGKNTKKSGSSPKTGDESQYVLWFVLISISVLSFVTIKRKSKSR